MIFMFEKVGALESCLFNYLYWKFGEEMSLMQTCRELNEIFYELRLDGDTRKALKGSFHLAHPLLHDIKSTIHTLV